MEDLIIFDKAQRLVSGNVILNVSRLVNDFLTHCESEYSNSILKEICEFENHNEDENDILEICEYWIISDFLARELRARGQCVFDFGGHNCWGRTTCGQSIYMDGVVQDIAKSLLINK